MTQTDIFISGGGVAGLTAAAAFGAASFSITIADPAPPITDDATEGADLRTTAFLQPARDFLDAAGVWTRLAPHATPLQVMRIVDAGGADPTPRVTRDFDAADIGDLPFGWNLPNWLMRREVLARLDALPNVTFLSGVGFKSMLTRTAHARVTLTDGNKITARLVIGADGRDSPVRHAAGIGARTTRYGQKAVTFAVTHDAPHDNVSTEVHRTGGPFTLVPLPDHNGTPCSAVVWMEDGAEAMRLAALPEDEFNAAATARSAGVNGPLTLASRRMVWPIISQTADQLTAERTALVAEAAHVMPPIGAQGLNMSLRDLSTLLDLATASPDTLGDAAMLDAYVRKRAPDIKLRTTGIDLLNRASQAENPLLRDLRAKGVEALYGLTPLRKQIMRLGLGAKG
ncbi:UbiH/UbiF family hydroxylase [Pseudooctadecabacter jejudonensis]|uniref:2-octaprenylphenol hydroxylase n=1 Tax=Pseudooctadecabacter jejudonensis TaxID=1391910 RepID=A0A1Y5SF23_9RHOB|nr:UbiH/UbiF family hydroxylase [Pseudooctadecabacter jejudonensis]SLN39314.1 2-octaprenylphenol hydroxylase [Pseudooctadecabacter jejudonensis]